MPDAGDDLLNAWRGYSDAIGVVVAAASIADARVKLAQAEADGHPPTTTNPAFFLINGITYSSTGKGSDNVWDLVPTNGYESYWQGLTKTARTYLKSGAYAWQDKFKGTGTRAYDRVCKVTATMWAVAYDGVDLVAYINGYEAYASFPTAWEGDGNTGSSVTVVTTKAIPAGVAPDIWVGVRGRRSTSWVQNDNKSQWASMLVEFQPLSMI